jgi:hypothetical protein
MAPAICKVKQRANRCRNDRNNSLIKDYDPKDIALAFDIRHATTEGGLSWPIQFNLVKSHNGAAYFKADNTLR